MFETGYLLIRKHLGIEDRELELDEFVDLYAQALWHERRQTDLIARAVAKAFSEKK